jgi:hypothetical protein
MSPLEPLAPDQRAVVALVLQQGRSYEEIATLLGIPVEAVRARAHAGLASLARDNGLPEEVTGPLADYLLGQQPARDAEATRGLLAESAPARGWAGDVAAQLADVAPQGLPNVPAAQDPETGPRAAGRRAPEPVASRAAAPGPRPRPVREPVPQDDGRRPPAASRLGGALLIAAVLAVVAIVLFVVLSGGDADPATERAAATATPAAASPTPSPTAAAQVADTIPLRSTTGGDAKGTMTVFLQDGRLLFTLAAQGVPQSREGAAYAVWFTGPGDKARRLGFTNPVGEDGRLGIQGPSRRDMAAFPKLYATYAQVVVSQETSEDASRPTTVILSGKLPKGR